MMAGIMSTIDLRNIKKDDMIIPPHGEGGYRTPRGFRLVDEKELRTAERLAKLESTINNLSSACGVNSDAVQLSMTTLDNCTELAQLPPSERSESDVAKLLRLRVCIGFNDDKIPIITQVSGHSETELADNVVKAVLRSGRASEFIDSDAQIKQPINVPAFGEYAVEWFTNYKSNRVKPTTKAFYENLLTCHLLPAWHDKKINEIDVQTIQGLLDSKADKAAATLHSIKMLLACILDCAMRDGYIQINPATDKRITIPSSKKEVREALTIDQLRDIISNMDKLKPMDRLYLALMIYTGERRGEILGLRWEDVDLQANALHIRQSVTYPGGNNQPTIATPKTQAGHRDIPIMAPLLEYLIPCKDHGYVIGGGEKPVTLSWHRKAMERINDRIDLHGASAHIFRHSLATMLNSAGANPKTIQGILGHSDISTTMNRYVHAVDDTKAEAINNVSAMLLV